MILAQLPDEARELLLIAAEAGPSRANRSAQLISAEARAALIDHDLLQEVGRTGELRLTAAAADVAEAAWMAERQLPIHLNASPEIPTPAPSATNLGEPAGLC